MEKTKRQRTLSLLLVCLTLVSLLCPMTSMAATQVSVGTKTNTAPKWDFYNSDGWSDLSTPWHYIEENGGEGPLAYCLQHKQTPPHGETYQTFDPGSQYSQRTINGLQIILELGYTTVSAPYGVQGAMEANYATSNAIRLWLSEETGGPNEFCYGFTNLKDADLEAAYQSCTVSGKLRANMNESTQRTFRAAIRLLQAARSQQLPAHTLTLTPNTVNLQQDGDYYVGSASITLNGVDRFDINTIVLPSGTIITDGNGNSITSGTGSMNVTIKVPRANNAAKTFDFVVTGMITGPAANLYWMTGGHQSQDIVYWSMENQAQTEKSIKLTTPKYGWIKIVKQDAETGGSAQGDADLKNAVFEIIADENIPEEGIQKGQVVQTLTLTGNTTATSGNLPIARYLVREKDAPAGYKINTHSYGVTVVADETAQVTVPNQVIKAPISIIKFFNEPLTGEPDNEQIKDPESGAKFEIKLKSSGTVYDTLITDQNGFAKSKLLPYGRYVVTQVSGKEGYKFVDPFEVVISQDSQDPIPYIIENAVLHNQVRIVKMDAETGEIITQAGVNFKVMDSDGNWVKQRMLYPNPVEIDVFETSADGTLTMPEPLRYGKYKLYEQEAPYMYLLCEEPVEFEINDGSVSEIEVKIEDQVVKGQIEITKTGDMFVDVDEEILDDGTVVKHPVFEKRALAGVEIEIIAAEDIVTPDNTVHAEKGEVLETIVTSAEQKNISKPLYLGRYLVREKSTADGYLLDTQAYEVTLEYADQHTALVMEAVIMDNERASVKVELLKEKEVFTDAGVYAFEPGKGFGFGLIANEDLFSADNGEESLINVGDVVAIAVTDETGKGTFSGFVPYSSNYLVKELFAASNEFELSEKEYPVDLSFQQDVPVIKVTLNDGKAIQNILKKVPVQISKTDITKEEALPGAKVEIYNAQGKKIYEGVTGDNGKTKEIYLPVNAKYTYKETATVEGYALNSQLMQFEITADGDVIGDLTIKNEVNRVVILKLDGKTKQPLPGVKFGLYDENGNLVYEKTSDDQGKVSFEKIGFGRFQIREIAMVEGYQLSGETIEVDITDTYENPIEEIEYFNYPIVKTGFEDFPWLAIGIVAGGLSIVLIGISRYKKRKK